MNNDSIIQSYKFAAGILLNNKILLLLCALIFAMIKWLPAFIGLQGLNEQLLFSATSQIAELLLVFILFKKIFKPNRLVNNSTIIKWLIIYGIFFWGIVILPNTIDAPLNSTLHLLSVFMSVAGFIASFIYYFFFVPILNGEYSLKRVLKISRTYTQGNAFLPFYAIITPGAIFSLLGGLAYVKWPDGRDLLLSNIADFFFGIQQVLTSVLGFSIAVCFAPKNSGFFQDKISSIEQNNSLADKFSGILSLRSGLKFLILGALVWSSNQARLLNLPPSPSLKLVDTIVEDEKISVILSAEDHKYAFRGFSPNQFVLAGIERTILSDDIISVTSDTAEDVKERIPAKNGKITLKITFKTDRTKEQSQKLQDVFLWYRNIKIIDTPLSLVHSSIQNFEDLQIS